MKNETVFERDHNTIEIDDHGKVVKWLVNGKCVRRFIFDNKDNSNNTTLSNGDAHIIKAGFIKFDSNSQECFIIILSDFAYVYYLSNQPNLQTISRNIEVTTYSNDTLNSNKFSPRRINDSLLLRFPFPVEKAFWYSNGIILQTINNSSLQYKFITLTDPLAPFGNIQINSPILNNDSYNNISNLEMLHFPNEKLNITVLNDKTFHQLLFFYTRILNGPNTTDTINSNNNITNVPKRKISMLNKRNDLLTDYKSNTLYNPNSGSTTNSISRRNLSATFDRMSNGINTISNNTDMSSTYNNGSLHLDSGLLESNDFQNQPRFQSKDVTLIQISTMSLPYPMDICKLNLKCFPLSLDQHELMVIFDTETKYTKIWNIHMIPNVINSIQFKIYGNSPPNMITLEDLKIDDMSIVANILDITPLNAIVYDTDTFEKICRSTLQINFEGNDFMFYNPFYRIYSPLYTCSSISNSTTIKFPQSSFLKSIFNALNLIVGQSVCLEIFYLWQYLYSVIIEPKENREFETFASILTSLIYSQTEISRVSSYLATLSLFQSLANREGIKILLPKIIMGLHLLCEELYLNILNKENQLQLEVFLSEAVRLMNWPQLWKSYYIYKNEDINYSKFITKNIFAHPLDEPPSIMKSLYSIIEDSQIPVTPFISFARLIESDDLDIDLLITPRCFKLLRLYEFIHSTKFKNYYSNIGSSTIMDILKELAINKKEIDSYPLAVNRVIKNLLMDYERNILRPDANTDLTLIERPDIERSISLINKKRYTSNSLLELKKQSGTSSFMTNEDENDGTFSLTSIQKYNNTNETPTSKRHHDTTGMNTPKDIYNLVATIVKKTLPAELLGETKSASQGLIENHSKLIFKNDKRFQSVESLLNGSNFHKFNFITAETDYSKILSKKKLYSRLIALRTLVSGVGRAALYYATEQPLTSQKWVVPELNLVTSFPDNTKMTPQIEIPRSDANPEALDDEGEIPRISMELVNWGKFHNGASYALMISPNTKGINGSWITLNKPRGRPNATHGGFLLGMGLNGHLKNLEEWHVYNYLSPKETFTSIGLLLGMSASCRGTKNFKLIKVLSVHVVALLPKGSNDLNINLQVQNAGLVGMGLLYQGHKDKKLNNSLIGEFKSFVKVGEEYISDESYRIAVGIALGLNNLSSDSTISDEEPISTTNDDGVYNIFSLANDHTSSVTTAKLSSFDEEPSLNRSVNDGNNPLADKLLDLLNKRCDKEPSWIPDNSQVGLMISLMLMFLKSENEDVASKIRLPVPQKDSSIFHRPELYMYRELSYYMIKWEKITGDLEFLMSNINLAATDCYDVLPLYYMIAGRALSIGIKFASTGDVDIRNCLISLIDRFLPFYQYYHLDLSYMNTQKCITITSLVNALLISVSMIMYSTGDLVVFRRLKFLHEVITGRFSDIYKHTNKMEEPTPEVKGKRRTDSNRWYHHHPVPEYEEGNMPGDNDNGRAKPSDKERDLDSHYGKYMVTSMCLGFLFFGSGQYALNTSSSESIAYIIISILPLLKNPYPLQELKYFWSMSLEPRCLIVKDAITEKIIHSASVEMIMKKGYSSGVKIKKFHTPCLLPDIRMIKVLKIEINHYYPLEFIFNKEFPAVDFFQDGATVFVQPKDENKEHIHTTEDIKSALGRRLTESTTEGKKAKEEFNFASKLYKDLGITDLAMSELKSMITDNQTIESISDKYNVEMLCTDKLSGDITDYQLELWKATQRS